MKTFTSSTGYAKRKRTGEVYEAPTLYLPDTDEPSNYTEATEEEYKAYEEKREKDIMPLEVQ
jgi:hypothetical protein